MHTQLWKWVSITALLLAVVFWRSAPDFQGSLDLVVSGAAAVVVIQAYKTKKYSWAGGFLGVALVFNPAIPLFPLAGALGLSLVMLAIAPFAISLVALRPVPALSIPSITDRNPGSQSL